MLFQPCGGCCVKYLYARTNPITQQQENRLRILIMRKDTTVSCTDSFINLWLSFGSNTGYRALLKRENYLDIRKSRLPTVPVKPA